MKPTAVSTPPKLSKEMQAATILERSVCLTLSCHWFGNHRQVNVKDLVDAAAGERKTKEMKVDEDQFHVVKRLIDPKVLNPCARVFGVAKAQLHAKAISAHRVFGERSYLIPLALVESVDADLVACEKELTARAQVFATVYEKAVADQRIKLGPLFRASDYLSKSAAAESFRIEWNYVSFAAPDKLVTVSHALAENAERKHTERLAAAFDEVLLGLRETALDVVTELEDRLTPDRPDRTKTLRGTALRDLQEFIEYLPKRNLTDDGKLVAAMKRIAQRAEGVTVQDLRDNEQLKAALRKEAAAAKAVLSELVETSRRGISFGGKLGAA